MHPLGVLINIFGGITRCDIVAQGIVQALNEFSTVPPIAIRLSGTNEKEGATIIRNAGLRTFNVLADALEYLKETLNINAGER